MPEIESTKTILYSQLLLVKSIPPPLLRGTFQEFTTFEKYPSPLNLMSNFNNYGSNFI